MSVSADLPTFHVVRFQVDGTSYVAPSGEVDLGVRDRFHECLAGCDGSVVVDLSDVTFFDSSAIGVLVVHRRRLGGALTVRNASEKVQAIFRMTGVDKFLS